MYIIGYTKKFERSVRLCAARNYDMMLLDDVIELLSKNGKLPTKYLPHKLKGKYIGKMECHIKPNWLLVWEVFDKEMKIVLIDTGTHSDLFER